MENQFRLGSGDPVMILRLLLTTWCNYKCAYCNLTRSTTNRNEKFCPGLSRIFRKNNVHAFDNYSVDEWLNAFRSIKKDFILEISGGEPFLDVKNFPAFIQGFANINNCKKIRVDTNGFWGGLPHYAFENRVKDKVILNISYHPSQVNFEEYERKINTITNAGWKIGMINYVMTSEQKSGYEQARNFFENKYGIFVNANPDSYGDPELQKQDLKNFLDERDLAQKSKKNTAGKSCFFPSIAYFINPVAEACQACVDSKKINFIKHADQLFTEAKPHRCPKRKCACLDMYAFLEDYPDRGQDLDLIGEYVNSSKEHQKKCE